MSTRTYAGGHLIEEWDDATRTYRRLDSGEVVEERPYTESEAAPTHARETNARREATRRELLLRIDAALAADLAYLGTPVPATAAERLARIELHVERLTRQVIVLLRLVGERLDEA